MGSTISRNTVEAVTDILINVNLNSIQTCQSTIRSVQEIIIEGNNIDISGINLSQVVNTDLTCVQSTDTKTNIDNNIKIAIDQISKAINQQFHIGGVDAENTTSFVTRLSTSINQTFIQTCTNNLVANQVIDVKGTNIKFTNSNFDQNVNATQSCIKSDSSVVSDQNSLSQHITQTATAEVESLFGSIVGMIIASIVFIVIIIVILNSSGGSSGSTTVKLDAPKK